MDTAHGSPDGPSLGPSLGSPTPLPFELYELSQPDIAAEPDLDPRLGEVAARLGYAASYAVPLIAEPPSEEGPAGAPPVGTSDRLPGSRPDGGSSKSGGAHPFNTGGTQSPEAHGTQSPGVRGTQSFETGGTQSPGVRGTQSFETGGTQSPGVRGTQSFETGGTQDYEASATRPHGVGPDRAAARGAPSGVDAPHVRPLGVAVWLYDEPAEPTERGRRLLSLYRSYAAAHLSHLIELDRRRRAEQALRAELLPARLPRVPGVRLAVRHATGPKGGGVWYDALPLPDSALSLSVGSVTGSGTGAVGAMGRMRAALRAYAVMEGEDPVAVLSDLELLLRLTEPARSATALFVFAEPPVTDPLGGPPARKIVLAGAGHCPPLIVGEHRTEFVETTLSAPLGMLSCWEAPSVELEPAPGETLLLYSDGLLHRSGEPVDRAFARLHAAAAGLPRSVREDPEALVDHIVRAMLPQGLADETSPEDVVLLAARFEC
ncbi:PP2C family protein-serine/threonine phosphatase [Streptomyces olivaceiscleroticus]